MTMMRIIPQQSVELAEKLIYMAEQKIIDVDSESAKLLKQARQVLQSTDTDNNRS